MGRMWRVMVLCGAAAAAMGQTGRTQPLGTGEGGLGGARLASTAGLEVKPTATAGKLQVAVKKTGAERRLLAYEVTLANSDIRWANAVELTCQATGLAAGAARVAVVIWEQGGGVRYRVGAPATDQSTAVRVPLNSLKTAAFSEDTGASQLDHVARIWFGVTIDGEGAGQVEISRAVLTSEVFRPTKPVKVDLSQPWSENHEPSVTVKKSLPNEGPHGEATFRFDVTYTGGKHQWSVPSVPVGDVDLDGYHTLRLTYKALLPKGPNLLIGISKRNGGTYIIDPPPADDGQWHTLDVPLSKLKLAGWTKDPDGKLTLEPGLSIQCGCHGQANPAGTGTIWVAGIEFLP